MWGQTHCWGHGNVFAWPLGDSTGTELNVPVHWQFTFFFLIKAKLNVVPVYDLFTVLIWPTCSV